MGKFTESARSFSRYFYYYTQKDIQEAISNFAVQVQKEYPEGVYRMNSYKKFNGTTAQTDLASGEQFTAKNVVIIFTKEEVSIDDEKHNYYEVVGDGDALVFNNGDVVEAEWNKETMFDRMLFTDEDGKEVSFVRGSVWIEVVAIGNDIDY